MSRIRKRSEWLVRLARSPWSRLSVAVLCPAALVVYWLAVAGTPLRDDSSSTPGPSQPIVTFEPTANPVRASVAPPSRATGTAIGRPATLPIAPYAWHANPSPSRPFTSASFPTFEARSAARPTVAVNEMPRREAPLTIARPRPPSNMGLPLPVATFVNSAHFPMPTLPPPATVARHGLKTTALLEHDPRNRSRPNHVAGSGRNAVWAVNGSGTTTVDIAALLGADRFYNAGYTGVNSHIANVEGGTPWRGHETMDWIPAGNLFWSGDGLNESTTPTSVTSHATGTSMNMIGKPTSGSTNPVLQSGIAFGINPSNFYAGNIASTITGNSFNWSSYTDFRNVYYRAIVEGVGANNTIDAANRADVVSSSWGGDAVTTNGAYNLERSARIIDAIAFEGGQTRGSTVVIAAGNSGSGANTILSPATGFNSIAVAALGERATDSAGTATFNVATSFSSRGPIDFRLPTSNSDFTGTDLGNIRARIDIAAPGFNMKLATTGNANSYTTESGTSFATPTVSGGVALLADYAWTSLDSTSAANAVDGRVMKAVLINSADKTSGWNNGQSWNGTLWSTTQGLDYATGGGRMNLSQAFNQYVNGSGNTITQLINPTGTGAHSVLSTGWARASIDRPNSATAANVDFLISSPLTKNTELNTTLSWYVNNATTSNSGTPVSFHNLNLEVWLTDGSGTPTTLVGSSTADHNNVEHLSFLVPQDGQYLVRVVRPTDANGGTYYSFAGDTTSDVFGLAWMARVGLQATTGTTTINSGTTQSQANVLIAPDAGQTATLDVSGAGTRINTLNRLYVGGTDRGAGGTGTLTLSGGAAIDVSNALQIFQNGAVTITDSTLTGGVMTINAGSSFTAAGNTIVRFSRIDASAPITVPAGGTVTFQSYRDFGGSNSGRLNLLSSSASFDINGQLTVQPITTGTSGLVKNGSGTLIVAPAGGTNSYSGTTLINAGTLQLGVANALPDGSSIRLNGGTFSTGSGAGFSDTVGALDLAASSTLALGTGSHGITFSGITGTPTGTLNITGWKGTAGASGTSGDVLFTGVGSTPNSSFAAFLATVDFSGFALGDAEFILITGSTYELVPAPVPEPGAVLGIAVSVLLVGVAFRRSGRKSFAAT
jgi:autotransporter-associated beta strand protein/T5SS/PEP-CTERM-associated repeat protein